MRLVVGPAAAELFPPVVPFATTAATVGTAGDEDDGTALSGPRTTVAVRVTATSTTRVTPISTMVVMVLRAGS